RASSPPSRVATSSGSLFRGAERQAELFPFRWFHDTIRCRRHSTPETCKQSGACASALSLSFHPMPFRITQESYRPRVSDRTMVGTLPNRLIPTFWAALLFSLMRLHSSSSMLDSTPELNSFSSHYGLSLEASPVIGNGSYGDVVM